MPDRPLDLVIKNVRVVRPRRPQVERLDLGVLGGRFARIAPDIPAAEARAVYDARARLGFPGVVDAHTHVGIYGPLAEDAVSESWAAVSGGVTTMLTYFRTGQYYVGFDADLALLDPKRRFTVRAAESPSAQGYTPFEGQELTGRVTATFLRGSLAWEDGCVVGPARGRYIHRPA